VISYRDDLDGIGPEQLHGFFVGWPSPPSPERHLDILRRSDVVVVACDESVSKLVGFVTAISDGVFAAFIPLLEVLPEYQHRGIGTALMRRMTERLRHVYSIDLVCDSGLIPFYQSFGMASTIGMSIRRVDRLFAAPTGVDSP